jgi:hypothetical protein
MRLIDLYRPVRRYSYLVVSITVLFAAAYFLLRPPYGIVKVGVFAGVLVALWLFQRLLRPGEQQPTTVEEVLRLIGRGRPTFVNFYSNL